MDLKAALDKINELERERAIDFEFMNQAKEYFDEMQQENKKLYKLLESSRLVIHKNVCNAACIELCKELEKALAVIV